MVKHEHPKGPDKQPKFTRVTVYLEEDKHRRLKSVLALEAISISEWIRRKIREKLEEENR